MRRERAPCGSCGSSRSWAYRTGQAFTAADVMMGFTLIAARSLAVLDDRFPKLLAYVGRLASRPAFQKLLAEQ